MNVITINTNSKTVTTNTGKSIADIINNNENFEVKVTPAVGGWYWFVTSSNPLWFSILAVIMDLDESFNIETVFTMMDLCRKTESKWTFA